MIEFIKCHGSGNDFVLIDELSCGKKLREEDYAPFSKAVCDRKGPVGADGILILQRDGEGVFVMRMFNPDGSEAEMCGNGIRCVIRQALRHTGEKCFPVRSGGITFETSVEPEIFPGIPTFSVKMPVSLDPATLPLLTARERVIGEIIPELDNRLRFTAISLGNPHVVAAAETIDTAKLTQLGEKAKQLDIFPKGVNVSLFRKAGEHAIFVSTYERGAGITFSCGTAMTASSTAAALLGVCGYGRTIDVYNRGGMVRCLCTQEADGLFTRLTGNATWEYEAAADYDAESGAIRSVRKTADYPEERANYERLKQHCQQYQ